MTDTYTQAVLHKAQALQRAGYAAQAMTGQHGKTGWLRAAIGALLAALMTLYPAMSAAMPFV